MLDEPEAILLTTMGDSEIAWVALCECGCWRFTKTAQTTDRSMGSLKGWPMRFIRGHSGRSRIPSPWASDDLSRPLPDRFWEKVDRSGGPEACWLWAASRNPDGYGQIRVNGRLESAHRLSWELAHPGIPIPPETPFVLHNCPSGDNPSCVNPRHLYLGNPRINNEDTVAKGWHRRVSHPGEHNGSAKLTEEAVREIRRCGAEGDITKSALALRFGVTRQSVSGILAGRTWAHVQEVEANVA